MNDKDKEVFEKWWHDRYDNYVQFRDWQGCDLLHECKDDNRDGWQAACEYKQKEIDDLEESLVVRLSKSYIAGKDLSKIIQKNLTNEVEKLQAENEKLKKCVEFYSEVFNWRDSGQDYGHGTIKTDDKEDLSDDDRVRLFGGKRARQCLRELAVDKVCDSKGW